MRPKYTLLTQKIDFDNILNECKNLDQNCTLHLAAKNDSIPKPKASNIIIMNVQNYLFKFVSVQL